MTIWLTHFIENFGYIAIILLIAVENIFSEEIVPLNPKSPTSARTSHLSRPVFTLHTAPCNIATRRIPGIRLQVCPAPSRRREAL